jgi:hypothetical protein
VPSLAAIAAPWLPLARKAAGLTTVPTCRFGRAWDRLDKTDRRMLAVIARQPDLDTVSLTAWQDLPAEQRTIIMVRARVLQEWLTSALNSGDTSGEVRG